MKNVLLCLSLLAAGPAAVGAARPPSLPAPTAAELKKKFARLAVGTEGESEAFTYLMNTTPRRLVSYLKTHELTAAGARKINLVLSAECKDAAHLKVFTYYYDSGGTRGTVHRPVLQWQNAAGQRFAYAPFEECEFTEIYQLASPGRRQYLLLGNDRGSGQCFLSQAYVIELKGNYLLVSEAAFANSTWLNENSSNSASLVLCNVNMEFNARRQALRMSTFKSAAEPDVENALFKWKGTHFAQVR
ncbi:MAG: hypothetical protein ACRYF0_01430 [Janthinobacterium lividum]